MRGKLVYMAATSVYHQWTFGCLALGTAGIPLRTPAQGELPSGYFVAVRTPGPATAVFLTFGSVFRNSDVHYRLTSGGPRVTRDNSVDWCGAGARSVNFTEHLLVASNGDVRVRHPHLHIHIALRLMRALPTRRKDLPHADWADAAWNDLPKEELPLIRRKVL